MRVDERKFEHEARTIAVLTPLMHRWENVFWYLRCELLFAAFFGKPWLPALRVMAGATN